MAVEKFSISLPEDLAGQVDDLAAAEGLTRSALIREATASYVASRASAAHEAERRARIDEALAGFDVVASAWGADDRSGIDYLREVRRVDGGPGRVRGKHGSGGSGGE